MTATGAELRYWLALARTPAVGSRTFLRLMASHSPRQLFLETPGALRALGLKEASIAALKNPDWPAVDGDLAWLEQDGRHLLTLGSPAYPPQLKEIPDPPPLLFVHGDPAALALPQIAIVGSRNPSAAGADTAFAFAQDLVRCGFAITSGLAVGIDSAGHRGALAAAGRTIAVAGTGLDRVYPPGNQALARQIAASGALVSEFPPGTPAKAAHFPRRNRIISGLCQGLLVVEAAMHSGSLITARLALEHNREVFAIPGSIHSPMAKGCHALIRAGAKLVETTAHILEELPIHFQRHEPRPNGAPQSALDLEQQTLLNHVMFAPTPIDALVARTGLPVEKIASMLLMLELQGHLEATPGGCYARLK